jgi:twitching motility protein PilT
MEMQRLLMLSVERGASDIHLMPNMKPLLRINGILTEAKDEKVLTAEDTRNLIYSIMTPEQQKTFEEKRVNEVSISVDQIGNFRASVLHQIHGIAAVLRIIPEKIPTFEELGLPPALKSLLILTQGLILVTGPAGSGKTTTLAAMIDYINSFRSCHIITIEDPIEFIYRHVKSVFTQMQVGRDTADFPTALKASLRQDPNVILVGELRDLETMRLALIAAETGHLVLATLHASSATMAVGRFIDVFPPEEKSLIRGMFSETIQAIVGQTLVKRNTGQGRVPAFDIMLAVPAIRHYIRKDMPSNIESTMQTSRDKGMCTLDQYLHELVLKNLISQTTEAQVLAERGAFKDIEDPKSGKKK